jgi:hypothetical protein
MILTLLFMGIATILSYLTLTLGEHARLVPVGVLVVLWICLLLQSAIDFVPVCRKHFAKLDSKRPASMEYWGIHGRTFTKSDTSSKHEWTTILWLLLLPGTVCIIGLLIGIPLWVFLYSKIRSRESWSLSLTMAAVSFGILYVIFVILIGRPLYYGELATCNSLSAALRG